MSDWTVSGPLDAEPFRWLNHRDALDWVADAETTRILTQPGGFSFPATPTGPLISDALGDESSLYAAALYLTGSGSDVLGDPPRHPGMQAGGAPPGVVY